MEKVRAEAEAKAEARAAPTASAQAQPHHLFALFALNLLQVQNVPSDSLSDVAVFGIQTGR